LPLQIVPHANGFAHKETEENKTNLDISRDFLSLCGIPNFKKLISCQVRPNSQNVSVQTKPKWHSKSLMVRCKDNV